jgi:hypothetical protein
LPNRHGETLALFDRAADAETSLAVHPHQDGFAAARGHLQAWRSGSSYTRSMRA